MKIQLALAVCGLMMASAGNAADTQARLSQELASVSAHIGSHTDTHAVANSLYQQLRPHVLISNTHLKSGEIDQRVRSYVAEKYTPVLLMRYSLVYNKMKTANKDFSSCSKLQPFAYARDVETAMCTVHDHGNIQVRYLVNEQHKGWEKTSEFVFRPSHDKLKLVDIRLNLKKGQKIHMDGL